MAEWYNVAWTYRQKIIIDHTKVSDTFTDYPLLITDAHLDLNLYSAGIHNDGTDLLFTLSDGTTKLDHEVELFDSLHQDFACWVRVPQLSATVDTEIYVYYGCLANCTDQGNKEAVWTAEEGVWHLGEVNPDGIGNSDIYKDATSFHNHGDDYMTSARVSGVIGKAQDFTGSDYIDLGFPSNLRLPANSPITIKGWIRHDNSDAIHAIIGSESYSLYRDTNRRYVFAFNGGSDLTTTDWYSDAADQFVVATFSGGVGGSRKIYVNGILVTGDSATFDGSLGSDDIRIGRLDTDYHDGIIDEVRILDTEEPIERVQTEYNNFGDTETFYSADAEEYLYEMNKISTWVEVREYNIFGEEPIDRLTQGTTVDFGLPVRFEGTAPGHYIEHAVVLCVCLKSDKHAIDNLKIWLDSIADFTEAGNEFFLDVTSTWTQYKASIQVESGDPGVCPQTMSSAHSVLPIGSEYEYSHAGTSQYIYLGAKIDNSEPFGAKGDGFSGFVYKISLDIL